MNNCTRVGLAGASALTLAAVVAVAPTSAGAATANNASCETTETCAFRHSGYAGGFADIQLNDPTWVNNPFFNGGSANDQVSSGGNVDRAITLYQHINYNGARFNLGVGQFDSLWSVQPNSHPAGFNFNDQVSSSSIIVPL